MPKRKWQVGEVVRGYKPKTSPENTRWMPLERDELKGIRAWLLEEIKVYNSAVEGPFLLPSRFDTPKKGTEGTQTTFLGKIDEGGGPEKE